MARRAIWVLSLLPAAFVLVMGYAEAVLLVGALGCFLALRPPATNPDSRPHFAVAGALAFAAALTRPVGVLLFLAIASEVIRWWQRLGRNQRAAGLGAVAAPFVGLLAFLGWSEHTVSDWWAPLRVQLQNAHHGGSGRPVRDPVRRHEGGAAPPRGHGAARAVGPAGPGHADRVLGRLPASYTLLRPGPSPSRWRAQPRFVERYALSAFPLSLAAAAVARGGPVERLVLSLLSGGLAGYALLAFLNMSVP